MSHYNHDFGTENAAQPTLTVKMPSSLATDAFGQLSGLNPSLWLQNEVHYYDNDSIATLSKRIGLEIEPTDIRRIFIRQEQDTVMLGVEFASHGREQSFLNANGKERLHAAIESLIRRAGNPFFGEETELPSASPPSEGLSFDRFVEVANEVDAMHRDAARTPRTVQQRLAEMKMRHAPENWAARVGEEQDSSKEPRR